MPITDVCLINPPLCVHEFPHLALPTLKSYLFRQGYKNIAVKDFNVEIMDEIITAGLSKVERYFSERGMALSYSEIKRNFDSARKTLLNIENQARDERAYRLINTYLRIAGSNIYDVCFCPESWEAIKKGFSACNVDEDQNEIISFIRNTVLPYFKRNPAKIIGISVPFSSQIYYAFVIGREIKRRFPGTRVIMGGPQISLFWKVFTSFRPLRQAFDAMIHGLGEIALADYIEQIQREDSIDRVPNLIYFDHAGELKVNPERTLDDINALGMPDFSDLPLDKYIYAKLPYQMTRGCYWSRCAFCSYRNTKGYRTRDLDQVLSDLAEMKSRYGRRIMHFIDDSIPPDYLRRLARGILKNNIDIRYDAYLRLDPEFTHDVCQLLGKSGLKVVLFGLESANKRILKMMRKGIRTKYVVEVLKNMKQAGIQSIVSCLIGFPTETKKEAWGSIEFLREHKDLYYYAYIVHFGMISDMCQNKDEYGIESIDFDHLVRYDDTGFAALGYPYKTRIGMSVPEAFDIIKRGRETLGLSIFKDNFFV